jgi:hypothetical protein
MDKPKTGSKPGNDPKARARELRAQTLAGELRANLKRRKAATRPAPEIAELVEKREPDDGSGG